MALQDMSIRVSRILRICMLKTAMYTRGVQFTQINTRRPATEWHVGCIGVELHVNAQSLLALHVTSQVSLCDNDSLIITMIIICSGVKKMAAKWSRVGSSCLQLTAHQTLKEDNVDHKWKTSIQVGNCNVRLLKNKENEVIREMECYNLDILGLSETKVRGNGMREINGTKYEQRDRE